LLEEAAASLEAAGRKEDAAGLAGPIGTALQRSGRPEEAIERTRAALTIIGHDQLNPDAASLSAVLGMSLSFAGREDEVDEHLDRALVAAQALDLPVPLCQALNARGVTYMQQSRFDEALGVWGVSADIAERNGLTSLRAVAQSNIANVMSARD